MDAEYLQGFYLGDLLIEPLKGRVSGRNGERHLPPKAAEVLVCLARSLDTDIGVVAALGGMHLARIAVVLGRELRRGCVNRNFHVY